MPDKRLPLMGLISSSYSGSYSFILFITAFYGDGEAWFLTTLLFMAKLTLFIPLKFILIDEKVLVLNKLLKMKMNYLIM